MSSLASSPPKGGGSPSLSSWTRMQPYADPHMRHPMMDPSVMQAVPHPDRRAMDPTGRRVMPEDMAAMGMPKGMPPHNMYMGEVRYGYMHRPYAHPSQYAQHPAHAYMAAERDYRHPDEHFGYSQAKLEGGGAVRDGTGGMEAMGGRLVGSVGPGAMGGMQHMEYGYPRRPGVDGGGGMMSGEHMMHDPHGMKMHPGFVNMYGGMGGGHVPFVSAQHGQLPYGAMHAHPVASFEVPGSRVVPTQGAKHNKYCHFCQHVKVRASGMLACCNKDCTRRFCEHCLSKSIGDDVNPQTSPAWIGGQWHCPVCRKLCCCALGECDKNHRHCKAYRYRVRRAEQQAFKRTGVTGGEDGEEGEGEEAAARPNAEKTSASVEKNSAKVDKDVRMTPVAAPVAPKLENASDVLQSIPVVSAPPAKGASNGATPQPSAAMMLEAPPQLLAHQQQQVKKEPSFTGSNASAKSLSPPRRMSMPGAAGGAAGAAGGGGGAEGVFDFHDVQSVADSWLKLFQDEDVEDDSFLFQGMNGPTRGGAHRVSRQPSQADESMLDKLSLGGPGGAPSRAMPRPGSSDSISGLSLQGRSMSQDLLQDAPGGMRSVGSNDSLLMMGGIMPRNMSTDSLGSLSGSAGVIPRNFSNSSLGAVMEAGESWPAEAGDGAGTPGGDFDYLAAGMGSLGGSGQYAAWPSGTPPGEGGGGLLARSMQMGGPAAGAAGGGGTGKRMVRTSSHNKLVNETAPQRGSGMPRPPSFEKLSRACRPEFAMGQMPSTQEDDGETQG